MSQPAFLLTPCPLPWLTLTKKGEANVHGNPHSRNISTAFETQSNGLMASTLHPAPPPPAPHPPTFSRNSTSTTMNGLPQSQSQSHIGSFDASQQSVSSTPAATPPPRMPMQQSMPFGPAIGANGSHNAMIRPAYGQAEAANGYGAYPPPQHQQQYDKPSIYTAIYSGVSVYEMEVHGIAVMRRRSDGWLNATQILKVAGVEKGKRTKVLEKEILPGEHEKVQGGYGKYQGTWINYQRGVEFCRQYQVLELLRPLLEYDMGQDGTVAGQGVDTPTKEQAMAAQRKRLYSTGDNRPPSQSQNGTFFKNISKAAVNAVNAITKARYESPGRQIDGNRRSNSTRRPSQHMMGSQDSYPTGSQQSLHSMASQNSFTGDASHTYINPLQDRVPNGEMQEPPRKRMRPSSSQEQFGADSSYDISMQDATPTEPNDSFVYHQQGLYPPGDEVLLGLDPLPQPRGKAAEEKQALLMNLFIDENRTDFSDHPAFITLSGEDLEIPLDGSANTVMHWAATLARIPLVRALIAKGASIFRVNVAGETALLRACTARNNLDKGTFPELLELLGPSIEIMDGANRTLLHHIAITSSIKGRGQTGKYYLNSLLEFIIQSGSGPNSQQNSFGPGMSSSQSQSQSYGAKSIDLGRFIRDVVNAQDKAGDTALNLAARSNNRGIIQQLIEVGANLGIPNRAGLKPSDFLSGFDGAQESENLSQQPTSQESKGLEMALSASKVGDTSRDIISTLSSTLADAQDQFEKEIRAREEDVAAFHAKIREANAHMSEEKCRRQDLQTKVNEFRELEQNINTLRRSASEYRNKLSQSDAKESLSRQSKNVNVGDADSGLDVTELLRSPHSIMSPAQQMSPPPLNHATHNQLVIVRGLPHADFLQARIKAYSMEINTLLSLKSTLKAKSSDLEARFREIVILCTGLDEQRVDGFLPELLKAVESEDKGGETTIGWEGRMQGFLEMVRGVDDRLER